MSSKKRGNITLCPTNAYACRHMQVTKRPIPASSPPHPIWYDLGRTLWWELRTFKGLAIGEGDFNVFAGYRRMVILAHLFQSSKMHFHRGGVPNCTTPAQSKYLNCWEIPDFSLKKKIQKCFLKKSLVYEFLEHFFGKMEGRFDNFLKTTKSSKPNVFFCTGHIPHPKQKLT